MVDGKQKKPINISFEWKLDLDYMTKPEMIELERLRKAERLSFFRIAHCALSDCELEIIKGKRFCSLEHMEEHDLRVAKAALEETKKKLVGKAKDVIPPKKAKKKAKNRSMQDTWKD